MPRRFDPGEQLDGSAPATTPGLWQEAKASMRERTPTIRLRLTPDDTADLPARLPGLLRDVGPGSVVVVDVGRAEPTLAELGLVLSVLWRRVGPHGEVHLAGATEAQLLAWGTVGATPGAVRAAVYGAAHDPTATPVPVSALTPAQRSAGPDRVTVPARG